MNPAQSRKSTFHRLAAVLFGLIPSRLGGDLFGESRPPAHAGGTDKSGHGWRKMLPARVLAALVITSLLAISTPGAPSSAAISAAEFGQDIRFAFLSGKFAAFTDWPGSIYAFFTGKSKAPVIDRIEIQPGDITIMQGESVHFAAVGFRGDTQLGGTDVKWTAAAADASRPASPVPNGIFTAARPGVYTITAAAETGTQGQATVSVYFNEGYFLQKLLKKNADERTTKEKNYIRALTDKGVLVSRSISSKDVYDIESERERYETNKLKLNEVRTRQDERRSRFPDPLKNGRAASSQPADDSVSQAEKKTRTHGPSADEVELPDSENQAPAQPPAASAPPLVRLAEDDGWTGTNWFAADDPANMTGTPAGTAPDVGAGNGNFQIGAPVLSLPGRGIDVSLALIYNSRLWSKAGSVMSYDSDKGFPAPGWSIGFGKMIYTGGNGGCMIVTSDGTRRSHTGTTSTYSSGSYFSDSYTAHTTDGSFVDYSCVYTSSTNGETLSGTATLPNGTRIDYASPDAQRDQVFPTRITDSQGNYITIAYQNNQGPRISTITDTLARTITFVYDASNRLVSITGPGYNGATRTFVRLHYRQINLNYAFASGITADTPGNTQWVIDAIYYPVTNNGYWFGADPGASDFGTYFSSYGMLARVTQQRGMAWSGTEGTQGTITPGQMSNDRTYNFAMAPDSTLTDAPKYTTETESWFRMDTAPIVTQYAVTETATDQIITVTRPDGTVNKQTSHSDSASTLDGLYYLGEIYASEGATVPLSKSRTILAAGDYGSSRPTRIEITDELGQMSATDFVYAANSYNQLITQKEYNYSGGLYRQVNSTYENNAAYLNRHIFNLPKSVETLTAAGGRLSRVEYQYDNNAVAIGAGNHNLTAASGMAMHNSSSDPYTTDTYEIPGYCITWEYDYPECYPDGGIVYVGDWPYLEVDCDATAWCSNYSEPTYESVYDQNSIFRGNVTRITTYTDAANLTGAISYDFTYDIGGNQRTATTDCCQQMSFNYTTATQYSQPESHTKGSADPASPHRMTESATYDFNTGVTRTSTDFNGRTTTFDYDAAARQTVTFHPTGLVTQIWYHPGPENYFSEFIWIGNDITHEVGHFFNGRGQETMRRAYAKQTENYWDAANWTHTDHQYDQMGRRTAVSIPHLSNVPTAGWTTFQYDALSRATQITAPDGSTSKTFYNETSRPDSASILPGQSVRSQDAWGRERWARTDDFGRLVEVVEPNPSGNGSVLAAGSLKTSYGYNESDELVGVTQGAQVRAFKYDSLGRLTRQKLAEQNASLNDAGLFVGGSNGLWSDAFSYDNRSNLIQRVDARGVKTNFVYNNDPLNRLQSVGYDKTGADTTYTIHDASAVTLSYMSTGDKTRVSTATSLWNNVIEENSYDIEGRVSEYKVTYAGVTSQPMVTSYLYDTVNRLTEVRYPASYGIAGNPRKIVTPSYDESSRLKELKVDNQIQMSEIVYNPLSQVTQLKTGAATGNADIEQYTYDNQTGLLTNQRLSKANTGAELMNLSYEYNRGNSNGTLNGKTGQMTRMIDNRERNRDRAYEFDSLGRLIKAKGGVAAGATGVTANWTQDYSYDRYGNKTGTTATGVTVFGGPVQRDGLPSMSYNTATNRMNSAGWEYDLAGNMTRGQNADGVWQRYEYDAAGRLKRVLDDAGNWLSDDAYGSSRQRVFRNSGGFTWYVWGGDSVLAEYTSTSWGGTFTWAKSYIYAGSRLLFTATNNGAGGELKEYHHPDRLGTRMVTDPAANTLYLQSTLPFGTQFDSETTGSSNRLFTSYDRSTPTGLDYAVNRTYSSGQGRFTQADPIGMASTSLGNPQSLNQFAYTQNSPTDFVDPSGLLLAAPNCRLLALEVFHSEVIEEAGGLVGLYACESDTGGGGAGYGIGHVVPNDAGQEQEKSDCGDFVDWLVGIIEPRIKRYFLSEKRIGNTFAKNLNSQNKRGVVGVKEKFTENGQGSGVYRHVLGGAASVLLEVGLAKFFQDLSDENQRDNDTNPQRRLEAIAELAGTQAGADLGALISKRDDGELSADELRQQIFDLLCDK